MLSEPMTLYKLMILYMLKQVNFPLTSAQLSNSFMWRPITTAADMILPERAKRLFPFLGTKYHLPSSMIWMSI